VELEFVLRMQRFEAIHRNTALSTATGGRNSAASRSTASGPELTRRRQQYNERADDAPVSGSMCAGR
jgi:molybdenum-dependent DNA-binding transcriptional regulator ModE